MNMPSFTADASLYKSKLSYRAAGQPGRAGPGVAPQLDCGETCDAKYAACIALCAIGGGPFCLIGCAVALGFCQSDCGGGGGGGGGRINPPHCGCGVNKKCCGKCVHQVGGIVFCDDPGCFPLNETCPSE